MLSTNKWEVSSDLIKLSLRQVRKRRSLLSYQLFPQAGEVESQCLMILEDMKMRCHFFMQLSNGQFPEVSRNAVEPEIDHFL